MAEIPQGLPETGIPLSNSITYLTIGLSSAPEVYLFLMGTGIPYPSPWNGDGRTPGPADGSGIRTILFRP